MSSRSLNKVTLIGNLTRDPELRYTPSGTAVCTFAVATNRQWVMESGEKREDTEFHRIVSWNKLAELCSQLLTKGRKVYVEGRLQTRSWTGQDGRERTTTEIVIDDMIILDPRRVHEEPGSTATPPAVTEPEKIEPEKEASSSPTPVVAASDEQVKKPKKSDENKDPQDMEKKEDIDPDEIPF